MWEPLERKGSCQESEEQVPVLTEGASLVQGSGWGDEEAAEEP